MNARPNQSLKVQARPWTEKDDAYLREHYLTSSHAEIGQKLGRTARSITNRCWRLGLQKKIAEHPPEITKLIRTKYAEAADGAIKLTEIANEIGIPRSVVAGIASKLGITVRNRSKDEQSKSRLAAGHARMLREKGHPKGMQGKSHSQEARRSMSRSHKTRFAAMTEDERGAHVLKALKTKHRKGILVPPRSNVTWKQGWRTIAGRRIYFRSKWEVNYACYLQWLKGLGEIKEWEYEPETFWFEAIRRGTRSYTPDFRVTEKNGEVVYHEVKGWMDDRSKTKLKRMAKYHPDVKIILVDAATYRSIARKAARLVPGWRST